MQVPHEELLLIGRISRHISVNLGTFSWGVVGSRVAYSWDGGNGVDHVENKASLSIVLSMKREREEGS